MNKQRSNRTHERLSTDHPITDGSRTSIRIVQDPYNKEEKIKVVASTRDDPLSDMLARRQITQEQHDAGRRWQKAYETAEIGVVGNAFKVRVDNAGSAGQSSEDAVLAARNTFMRAKPVIGDAGFHLLAQILGKGQRIIDIVEQEQGNTSPESADLKYVGRRFREVLETLVDKGSHTSSVSYLFPGRVMKEKRVKVLEERAAMREKKPKRKA